MVELMMKRISKAQAASLRANNPQFRVYWSNVAEELMAKLKSMVN